MKEKENIKKLVTGNSPWIANAERRIQDNSWREESAKIALTILRYLRKNNIKQFQLAEMINVTPQQVSKIVKGKENFTLQTINKIEKALNIKLVQIVVDLETNLNSAPTQEYSNIFNINDEYDFQTKLTGTYGYENY